MPVTLDQTETTQVQTTSSQDITTVQISGIDIDVDGQSIRVKYSKGYMDGENFVQLKRGRGHISGDAFLAVVAGMEDAVYAQLIAQGDFAGTIS